MSTFFLVFIAGILLASYAFVLSFLVKKCHYPWETVWTIYTLVGLFIYPWFMAISFIPVQSVLAILTPDVLFRALAFGFLFGLGNSLFGFVVPIIGVSTASAINPSIVLSIGALAPLLLADATMLLTPKGFVILASVFVLLLSLTITYLASLRREREQKNSIHTFKTSSAGVSFRLGLIFCVVSGVFAAQQNIGFYLSKDINHLVGLQSVPSYAISYLAWALSMTGTTIASLSIAGLLLYRNRTASAFLNPQAYLNMHAKNEGVSLKVTNYARMRLFLMASLMGLCQTSAFILYGMGSDMLGKLGPSVGFAIFCGTSILTNQLIGFIQGDWNNTSKITKGMIYLSVFLIISSIITLTVNSLR